MKPIVHQKIAQVSILPNLGMVEIDHAFCGFVQFPMTNEFSDPEFSDPQFSNPEFLDEQADRPELPRIKLLTMLRLGLFQMGLGMMSVLLFGLLNRILIKELGIPGTIAGIVLAVTLFVAPARIWFGQLSDTKPIAGLYRTNYVVLGAIAFAVIAFLAVQPIWNMGLYLQTGNWAAATPWIALSTLLFGLYGIAVSASSTPFATLLVDITDESDRSKVVAIDWAMLLMGTIAGAITIGILLRQLGNDPPVDLLRANINRLFLIVPWIVVGLAVIGTWGIEKKYSRYLRSQQAASALHPTASPETVTLARAWQILTASRQTRFFFTFLIAMTLGLFLQDAILEPFGGDIFKLPPGETTQLNVPYGVATVIGILIAGFLITPRIGKQKTAKLGCQAVVLALLTIIFAGWTGNPQTLKVCLFLFGLASGTTTTGAITLMLDLTAAETAGTFIGAWGLSQALARGMAAVFGGTLLDVGGRLFTPTRLAGSPHSLAAYGLVFALQACCMLGAIGLLTRVNVQEFKTDSKEAIAAVIASGD
ncbi:MAG: BCD family MFS transporter [Synechococcales bacterium]|nr:BCD family MFS transporter [Synechococcales bacterium]